MNEILEMRRTQQRGMTLAESLVSIVIVGVMAVAALNLTASAVQGRQIRATSTQAKNLAIDLLWEIMASSYEENNEITVEQKLDLPDGTKTAIPAPLTKETPVFGPETGEADGTRRNFDDIDDYNSWTSKPPENKTGTPIPGYDGWTRTVDVKYARLNDPKGISISDDGIKKIIVTVKGPRGTIGSVAAVRAHNGMFDQPPTIKMEYVSWVGIELQSTGGPYAVTAGAGSINLAE